MTDSVQKPEYLVWTPELVDRFWNGFSQTRLTEWSFAQMNGRSVAIAIDLCLPPDARVLDFGAGDGHLIKFLCARGRKVAAYEPSQGRREQLARSLEAVDGFMGVVGPDTELCFDAVVMSEVIEHVLDEQMEQTLRQLHRLIKPGGMLVVTTPNNEDLELGMAYCPVSNKLFHRWQHVRSFTVETLPALLGGYGFTEIATHRVDFEDKNFVPFDPLWGDYAGPYEALPFHIRLIRERRPCYMGNQNNLLYFGERV